MAEKRRPCIRCLRNRSERFYVSPRGKTCIPCRRTVRQGTTKNTRLQLTYGLTLSDYAVLLTAQGGVCAICRGTRARYDVDHCHKAVRAGTPIRASIRGLLCARCNRRLLPAALDNPALLIRAAEYLTNPPAQPILNGAT